MGVCNCSMFCCTLLYVHSSIAIILMGKRELIALLNLSSWCLVMVERLFLAVPRGCLQFVIVVFLDHTHLLFFYRRYALIYPLLIPVRVKKNLVITLYCNHLGEEEKVGCFTFILFLMFSSSSSRCFFSRTRRPMTLGLGM